MEFYLSATSIIPDKIRDAVNAIKIFAHEVIVRLDTKTVIFYAGYNYILVNEIIFRFLVPKNFHAISYRIGS